MYDIWPSHPFAKNFIATSICFPMKTHCVLSNKYFLEIDCINECWRICSCVYLFVFCSFYFLVSCCWKNVKPLLMDLRAERLIVHVIILLICVWKCERWCQVGGVQMLQKCLSCYRHHCLLSHTVGILCSCLQASSSLRGKPPTPRCLALHSLRWRQRWASAVLATPLEGGWGKAQKRSSTQTSPHSIHSMYSLFFDTTVTVLPGLLVDPIIFLVYSWYICVVCLNVTR